MGRVFLIVLAVLVSGCLTSEDSELPEVTGQALDGSETTWLPGNVSLNATGNGTVHLGGALPAGTGFWVTFPFNDTLDEAATSYTLSIDSEEGCGGRFLFMPPTVMQVVEGAHHYPFAPNFQLGTTGTGGSSWTGSSEPSFTAATAALVAETAVCFDLELEVEAASLFTANVTAFEATWSNLGPYTATDGEFTVPGEMTGWTHAHRVPACETPVEGESPSHLIAADLTFANEIRLRAGPYMNGIFPGPTVDDAVYFGVFHDTPGSLVAKVAAPTPECLVVVNTDLSLRWLEPEAGYVDRWWRQEPLIPL